MIFKTRSRVLARDSRQFMLTFSYANSCKVKLRYKGIETAKEQADEYINN